MKYVLVMTEQDPSRILVLEIKRDNRVHHWYIDQKCAPVTGPLEQLACFKKVVLDPAQSKTINFVVVPYDISFINAKWQRVGEPGISKLWRVVIR